VMCEAQSLCTSVIDMTQASRNTYNCPQHMTRYNEEEEAPIQVNVHKEGQEVQMFALINRDRVSAKER